VVNEHYFRLAKLAVTKRHLLRLGEFGFGANILNKSLLYLNDCPQQTTINGAIFSPSQVKSGLPQSSILEPIWYFCYTFFRKNSSIATYMYCYVKIHVNLERKKYCRMGDGAA
jgi:hypothetical protein